jgi:hypothetical protein
MSGGYAVASTRSNRIVGANQIKRAMMKLTFKQKLRQWLFEEKEDSYSDSIISVEESKFNSEGMRLQVYRASGGFVIETRHYNRRKDENMNAMFVITEDQDLGAEIGKIITMETLKS